MTKAARYRENISAIVDRMQQHRVADIAGDETGIGVSAEAVNGVDVAAEPFGLSADCSTSDVGRPDMAMSTSEIVDLIIGRVARV